MSTTKRIAINSGGGYVPGLNAVVTGTVLAANRLGWEVVGIRDGYDGLLLRGEYPDGGLIKLESRTVVDLAGSDASILGTGARTDPFAVREISPENAVMEVDRSDELLSALKSESIDAVVSIVGASAITGTHALNVAFKLHRKGLPTVCIPKSIENDVADTALSFGYNSALSFAVELLGRIRIAALDTRRIAVVEVPGHHAGWLALQAGMAVCCDAVLIPEVPYDLKRVAQSLREQEASGRRVSLVVVAEGAVALRPSDNPSAVTEAHLSARRASLSPLSDPLFGEGDHVIERAGRAAESVALNLQRLTGLEMVPFAIGQLVRGGSPTAVDRQLGLGSGAGAVRALESGRIGVMVAFQPPDLTFVPLVEALNRIRSVPMESELIHIARGLGISLGD